MNHRLSGYLVQFPTPRSLTLRPSILDEEKADQKEKLLWFKLFDCYPAVLNEEQPATTPVNRTHIHPLSEQLLPAVANDLQFILSNKE
jgi:hypothetical protein